MHADFNFWTNDRWLFENIFDSLGFAHEFAFCQNNGSLKMFQNVFWKKSFKHAKRYQV